MGTMAAAPSKPIVLDALQLDEELESLLYARCRDMGSYAGAIVHNVEPEMRALLRASLWYISARTGEASPAQLLLNMHRCAGAALPRALQLEGPALEPPIPVAAVRGDLAVRVPRARSMLYGALVVLMPWLWTRLTQFVAHPDHPERHRWLRWMRRVERATDIVSLLITFRFIHSGHSPPTLPMALVGMRLVHTRPAVSRRPAFELAHQQLWLRVLAQFSVSARELYHSGGYVVPAPALQQRAQPTSDSLSQRVAAVGRGLGLLSPKLDDDAPSEETDGCVFCGACPAHTPSPAPCGHMCCYFCLAVARMASSRRRCPRGRAPLGKATDRDEPGAVMRLRVVDDA